jgi:hypothetical protein
MRHEACGFLCPEPRLIGNKGSKLLTAVLPTCLCKLVNRHHRVLKSYALRYLVA